MASDNVLIPNHILAYELTAADAADCRSGRQPRHLAKLLAEWESIFVA